MFEVFKGRCNVDRLVIEVWDCVVCLMVVLCLFDCKDGIEFLEVSVELVDFL